jgi:hypothetical protein
MAQLVYTGPEVEPIIRYIEQEWTGLKWVLRGAREPEASLVIRAPKDKLLRFKLLCPYQAKQVDFYETNVV